MRQADLRRVPAHKATQYSVEAREPFITLGLQNTRGVGGWVLCDKADPCYNRVFRRVTFRRILFSGGFHSAARSRSRNH